MPDTVQHYFVTKPTDADRTEAVVVTGVTRPEDAAAFAKMAGANPVGDPPKTYVEAKTKVKEANAARPPQSPGHPQPGQAPAPGAKANLPPAGNPTP